VRFPRGKGRQVRIDQKTKQKAGKEGAFGPRAGGGRKGTKSREGSRRENKKHPTGRPSQKNVESSRMKRQEEFQIKKIIQRKGACDSLSRQLTGKEIWGWSKNQQQKDEKRE